MWKSLRSFLFSSFQNNFYFLKTDLFLTTAFTFLFNRASFLCACGPFKVFFISSKCLLLVSGIASLNNQHATCKLFSRLAAPLNSSLVDIICIFQ